MIHTKLTIATLISSVFSPVQVFAQNIIGPVTNPVPQYAGTHGEGLFVFLGNILKLLGTVAGIYMIVQIIMAGYTYISANGDEKKVLQAWNMIWQSLLGMVIIASAFVIASIITRLTGIEIITPTIYGP